MTADCDVGLNLEPQLLVDENEEPAQDRLMNYLEDELVWSVLEYTEEGAHRLPREIGRFLSKERTIGTSVSIDCSRAPCWNSIRSRQVSECVYEWEHRCSPLSQVSFSAFSTSRLCYLEVMQGCMATGSCQVSGISKKNEFEWRFGRGFSIQCLEKHTWRSRTLGSGKTKSRVDKWDCCDSALRYTEREGQTLEGQRAAEVRTEHCLRRS